MPISDAMFQGDMQRRLAKLERRVEELTSGRRLEDASVGARGIRLVGSSIVAQDPQTSQIVARFGIDPETGDVGLMITDPDTGRDVSLSMMAFGLRSQNVNAAESHTGGSGPFWVDLDTPGPEVTVRVADQGRMLVRMSCEVIVTPPGPGAVGIMGWEADGPTPLAISGITRSMEGGGGTISREFLSPVLDGGLYTVRAKYAAGGGADVVFHKRTVTVQPI